jgi:hypothetical protein
MQIISEIANAFSKMKLFLPIILIISSLHLTAQESISPESLARDLCPPHFTDRQKTESIFRWITDNISYNLRLERNKFPDDMEEDDTSMFLKPLDHRVAETVLKRRQAVCDGYARLFKSLCDHAGVRSELVTGYARTSMSRNGDKFKTNHSWNAVLIDSSWHLLDVTWASGYITFRADQFVRSYDPTYFLTDPSRFIQDHYPENLKWTLLEKSPVLKEFERSPFRYGAFTTSRITNFYPRKGILTASPGDTLHFNVDSEFVPVGRYNVINVSEFSDEDTTLTEGSLVNVMPGSGTKFQFVIGEKVPEWLYVSFNGAIILRYKLNAINNRLAKLEAQSE